MSNWRTPFDKEESPFNDSNSAHIQQALYAARDERELNAEMLAELFERIGKLEGKGRERLARLEGRK